MTQTLLYIALICLIGYTIGAIPIFGFKLGTSGILLTALVFGHFGLEIPAVVQNLGLACFVATVGIIAGPQFFSNFRKKAFSYILIAFAIVAAAFVLAAISVKLLEIPVNLCMGILTGALTSTPGLAAAIEACGSEASVGYGIAYPFGVVGVVLFVQLIPKLMKVEPDKEMSVTAPEKTAKSAKHPASLTACLILLSAAVAAGMLLAKISIPLGNDASFSLGVSGGPLFAGLLLGFFAEKTGIDFRSGAKSFEVVRELGLAMFLLGAGVSAGAGFVDILREHGAGLFAIGAMMTVLPMLAAWLLSRLVFKLGFFDSLGAICGGMTSTPALGSLISVAKSDAVASFYAATYPFALIFIVLGVQLIPLLF